MCSSKEIAPFYWIYKRNYKPWPEVNNFIQFMRHFKDLFCEGGGGLQCDMPDEMMFSLAIVFYFDRQIHS